MRLPGRFCERLRSLKDERGFLLLGIVTIASIGGILSGVAVQAFSVVARRSREADLIFYLEQYAAAIRRYQEANGGLPTKLEELNAVNATVGLYLRHPYTDPMTRNATLEDWCLIKLSATGRTISSCAMEGGDPTQLGLGSSFQLGEQTSAPNPRHRRNTGGVAGGQGIVGVHSHYGGRAFNILKRGEETYDRWFYTSEDYKKEMTTRAIPGLAQTQGPGLGKGSRQEQQPGGFGSQGRQGRKGRKGGSSFGNSGRRRKR